MPIYEYVCQACGQKSSLLFGSFSSVAERPHCPHCHSRRLTRALSRPALIRSARNDASLGELRTVDPRKTVEHLSRQYDASGIDPGHDFEDVAQRAAAGDSPETLHEMVHEARQKKNKPSGPKTAKP